MRTSDTLTKIELGTFHERFNLETRRIDVATHVKGTPPGTGATEWRAARYRFALAAAIRRDSLPNPAEQYARVVAQYQHLHVDKRRL